MNSLSFREFCGWGQKATKAFGLLVIRRVDLADCAVIAIPKNTRFVVLTSGQIFQNPVSAVLNESQNKIELLVQAENAGRDGNIPANQVWQSPSVRGISASNPQKFSRRQNQSVWLKYQNFMIKICWIILLIFNEVLRVLLNDLFS